MQGFITDPPSAAEPVIRLDGITISITGVDQTNATANVRVENLQDITVVDGTLDTLTVALGTEPPVEVAQGLSAYTFQGVAQSTSAQSTVITVTATSGSTTAEREIKLTVDCSGPVFTTPPEVTSVIVDQTTRNATVAFAASDNLTGLDATKTRYFVNSPEVATVFAENTGTNPSVFTGLSRAFGYTFKVAVEDLAGNRSEAIVVLGTDSVPVPDTSDVVITYTFDVDNSKATMSWSGFKSEQLADTNPYRILFAGTEKNTDKDNVTFDVSPGTSYSEGSNGTAPKLKARNSEGVYSTFIDKGFDAPQPTPPTSGTVTAETDDTGTVLIAWSGFADPDSGIEGYAVSIDDAESVAVGLATEYTATGLAVGVHTAKVIATNGVGLTTEVEVPGGFTVTEPEPDAPASGQDPASPDFWSGASAPVYRISQGGAWRHYGFSKSLFDTLPTGAVLVSMFDDQGTEYPELVRVSVNETSPNDPSTYGGGLQRGNISAGGGYTWVPLGESFGPEHNGTDAAKDDQMQQIAMDYLEGIGGVWASQGPATDTDWWDSVRIMRTIQSAYADVSYLYSWPTGAFTGGSLSLSEDPTKGTVVFSSDPSLYDPYIIPAWAPNNDWIDIEQPLTKGDTHANRQAAVLAMVDAGYGEFQGYETW